MAGTIHGGIGANESGGFFDEVSDGDRLVSAELWNAILASVSRGTGGAIRGVGGELAASPTSPASLSVRIASGIALLGTASQRRVYYNGADTIVALDAADPSNPRIDRVGIRMSATARTIGAAAITGTPAASPVLPAIPDAQDADSYFFEIAQVQVGAADTAIQSSQITDRRTYAALSITAPELGQVLFTGSDGDVLLRKDSNPNEYESVSFNARVSGLIATHAGQASAHHAEPPELTTAQVTNPSATTFGQINGSRLRSAVLAFAPTANALVEIAEADLENKASATINGITGRRFYEALRHYLIPGVIRDRAEDIPVNRIPITTRTRIPFTPTTVTLGGGFGTIGDVIFDLDLNTQAGTDTELTAIDFNGSTVDISGSFDIGQLTSAVSYPHISAIPATGFRGTFLVLATNPRYLVAFNVGGNRIAVAIFSGSPGWPTLAVGQTFYSPGTSSGGGLARELGRNGNGVSSVTVNRVSRASPDTYLTAPNGNRYRLTVSNTGVVSATRVT